MSIESIIHFYRSFLCSMTWPTRPPESLSKPKVSWVRSLLPMEKPSSNPTGWKMRQKHRFCKDIYGKMIRKIEVVHCRKWSSTFYLYHLISLYGDSSLVRSYAADFQLFLSVSVRELQENHRFHVNMSATLNGMTKKAVLGLSKRAQN